MADTATVINYAYELEPVNIDNNNKQWISTVYNYIEQK